MHRLSVNRWWLIAVILILSVAFHDWFFQLKILTQGDWTYYTNLSLSAFRRAYFSLWLSDQSFGRGIIDVGQAPTYSLYGLLAYYFNIPYAISERIIHLWPAVIISPISAYFFLKQFSNRMSDIFAGGLVYCCNTYFLQLLTGDITIAVAYAIAPFCIYLLMTYLSSRKLFIAVEFALACFVLSSYEPRIFYVLLIAAALYVFMFLIRSFIFRDNTFGSLITLLAPLSIIFTLNLYWLLGVSLISGYSGDTVLARELFGNHFFKLTNALTLSQPFWTGYKPVSFVYHSIDINQFVIPIIAVLGLMFNKRNFHYLYLTLLGLIGILLGKQVSEPLTNLYPYLYLNLPGFNAFREGTKFYVLIAISFSGLATLLFSTLKQENKKGIIIYYGLFMLLAGSLLFNLRPFVNNDIGTTFVSRTPPPSYTELNSTLYKDKNFSRVLSVPTQSKWTDNTFIHPLLNTAQLVTSSWKIYTNDSKANSDSTSVDSTSSQIANILTKNYSELLFAYGGIKYVTVPLRDLGNDDDFYKDYGNDRSYYPRILDQLPWLRRATLQPKDVSVYTTNEIKNYFNFNTVVNAVRPDQDLEKLTDFQNNAFHVKDLNFQIIKNNHSNLPSQDHLRNVIDIGNNINSSKISDGKMVFESDIDPSKHNVLYSNDAIATYSFNVSNNIMTFSNVRPESLKLNSAINEDAQAPLTANSITLAPNKSYSLLEGNKLLRFDQLQLTDRLLNTSNNGLYLLSSNDKQNLVDNGSFESGLWQSRVEDCNYYDRNAKINMARADSITYAGQYSLMLAADNHTACTSSSSIPVEAGSTYSLNYHYQIKGGQKAGYDLVFNDVKKTVLSEDQIKSSGRWFNEYIKFIPPAGSTSVIVRLKGYPDDLNKAHAQTYYDSVSIQALIKEAVISEPVLPTYNETPINSNKFEAKIENKSYNFKNLITNPSLEFGLWQKKVGDCNAYDNKPLITQFISSKYKTDGKQALELNATRHVACTGPPPVTIKESKSYLLSFDYQSPNAKEAGYYISFDDPSGTVISEKIPIKDKDWHKLTKTFTVPFDATSLSLSVYSYADEYGGIKVINRYDNFNLVEIPTITDRYYLVSTPKTILMYPEHANFQFVSSTKKTIQIKKARTPFFLNMSESYNPKWRLELDDNNSNHGLYGWSPNANPTTVDEQDHYNYDGFLNSWYVDPLKLCATKSSACTRNTDGTYDLKLVAEFTPQRYFNIGLIISGTSLVVCISYLGYNVANARKKSNLNN